jgi:hypothetical protein
VIARALAAFECTTGINAGAAPPCRGTPTAPPDDMFSINFPTLVQSSLVAKRCIMTDAGVLPCIRGEARH